MISRLFNNTLRNMSHSTSQGVELSKIIGFMESFAPKALAEKWDNTGLLVEPMTPRPVQSVLLTNDLTEDVISEALNLSVGLIISYHPPIFKPLTKLTTASWKERIIGACLENKIAVYSPHTSWDSLPGGVNDWLARAFDVSEITPIIQNSNSEILNSGAGRYCKLKMPIKIVEAVQKVKKLTSLNVLNLALARGATLDKEIKNVAICAGSGSSVLESVTSDLFLTGEMSHHALLDATHNGTSVILCNHSNSERGFLKEFAKLLEAEYSSYLQVYVSKEDKDPIQTI